MEKVADIQLMMRVRRGNPVAFEVLHARYQQKLLNFFYVLSRDESLTRDLCQETFLRIWKIRKRYRATGPFGGYLFGVARMIWLERLRRLQREQRLGIRCTADHIGALPAARRQRPDAHATSHEIQDALFCALETLPEEQRLVFVLSALEGLSIDAIAAALDCPRNTVRSRKILAMKKLRHHLQPFFDSLFGALKKELDSDALQTR